MSNQKKTAKANTKKQFSKKQEERFITVAAIAFGIALLGVFAFVFGRSFYNTGWARRHIKAVSAGGESLSVVDYNFYFYRSFYEYMSNADSGAANGMYSVPDTKYTLSSQYVDTTHTTTWQDYFDSRAESLIKSTYAYYKLAKKAGFTLSEEMQADVQNDYDEKIWFESVELTGVSEEDYLEANYGAGMTKEVYLKNLTVLYTAINFKAAYKEQLAIDDAVLAEYYNERVNDYKTVSYELFYINGNPENNASASMALAKQYAEELAACTGFEDFKEQAKQYREINEGSYWTSDTEPRWENAWTSIAYLRDWLKGERSEGDTFVAEAANGYYVAYYLSSNDNRYDTVNLKYFAIQGETAGQDAKQFLQDYSSGEQTVQSFFELSDGVRVINYNSADRRKLSSITYDAVTLVSVPAALRDWAFGEGRKVGDTTSAKDASGTWYVAYFDGYGAPAWRALADKELRTEYYNNWTAEVEAGATFKTGPHFGRTAVR